MKSCVCNCIVRRCVCISTRYGLGLAGSMNSVIGGDVPEDNLWSDHAMESSGSLGGLLKRA